MKTNYADKFNKFEIATEILINRYMLTALLVNVNNLLYYIEYKEKAIRGLLPKAMQDKLKQQIKYKDVTEFDRFSISSRFYNALVKEFNAEVVSQACVILDSLIKNNPSKVYSQPQINRLLKGYCKKQAATIKASDYLSTAIEVTKGLDYKLIDNETVARQYIAGTPFYMQSIDPACQYLKEKFNL